MYVYIYTYMYIYVCVYIYVQNMYMTNNFVVELKHNIEANYISIKLKKKYRAPVKFHHNPERLYTGLNSVPQNSLPVEPVNVTSFGKRVFADAVKFIQGHAGLGCTLSPASGVLIRRGEDIHREKMAM